jgi:3-oxoacyl-[acyl-carrier-protein] synthase II
MNGVVVAGLGVASAALAEPGDLLARPVADVASVYEPAAELGRGVRYKDRATKLAMVAADRALRDAALLGGDGRSSSLSVSGHGIGVVGSSNLGNLDTVCRTAEAIASGSVTSTSPMALPNASSNIVASSVAVRFGLRGPNLMVCNGASSGLDAVRLGALLVVSGRVTRVVVVGVEPVNEVVTALTGKSAGELFDGAVAVVLESERAAQARGVVVRARLGRYARCADVTTSIARVVGGRERPGVWFAGATAKAKTKQALLDEVPRKDLEAVLGAASGALGVLQVAAGVQWLGDGGSGPVLATAGSADDGVSSMLLAKSGAAS